jgi:Zn finger protein HypA/HybF involved in hydrogenase expression
MHEKSVVDRLIQKIIDLAKEKKASQVVNVKVKLGALSQFSVQHFKGHFYIAAKGTIAESAEIEAIESQDIHDPNASSVVLTSIDVS